MRNIEVLNAENGFYHKGVMTGVLDYRYNYELRRGDIRCTGPADKSGVIKFFTDIDPSVEQVVVYIDSMIDERYALEEGEWIDLRPVTK